jgi:protein TonB
MPPEIDPREETATRRGTPARGRDLHLGGEDLIVAEQGVFSSFFESLRDLFFPPKLPPLVLESTPIPVPDRMAVKRDPTSTAIAVVLHVLIIGAILFFVGRKVVQIVAPKQAPVIVALDSPPPVLPPSRKIMGGGGGQKGPAPVSKGNPPKFSPVQIVPPKVQIENPKLAVAPTIDVDPKLKMQTNLPNIGMINAPNVGVSMGNGNGNGLGSGNGNGMGPGSGGGYGGGVRQVGGGVGPPTLIYKVEAEFSEEARKAKVSGNVVVGLVVDEKGNATHVHVVRGLGMGLDEKAVEAVRQFRFKPALENGKPVKVEVNVEVNFQIF